MKLLQVAFLATLAVLARAKSEKRQSSGTTCIPQDIVFMVDSSSYVGVANFQHQLDFIKNNIRYYNLSPQCTHISVVTYSSGVYNQFYLNQYHTLQELNHAIDGIQYRAGGSNTADAINWVYQNSFTSANGGRTGIPHYAIWVGGSSSSNPALTVTAANTARNNGMTFFSVGVGNGYNSGELRGITDSDKNMFTSQNYNSLNTVAEPLATRINGAVTPSTSQVMGAPNSCLQQADIAFLIDGSGSIGSANFLKLENFVKGIVGKLDVAPDKTHVGVVQFSNYPKQEFPLNMYTSRQDVMTGIDSMHYMGGGTNTADGIKYLREHVFTSTGGARPNVPRIAIVITDGQSANPPATTAEADKARQDHIGLLAVGVGSGVSINELHNIADNPDSANTFTVSNYDQLDQIVTQIINRACTVQATAPPPTSASSVTHPPDPCQNKIADCERYEKSVCSGTYFGWAKDNCPRYCGFCVPLYTEPPPPCVDKLTNCHEFPPTSCEGNFTTWAHDNCRKYCGYCVATSQSVGFYGKCFYKNQVYKQGETWDDGCDYQCTCTDGATGKYQCFNKCPVYYNLPSQCTLVKDESNCCLQPVCDFNPVITSSETLSPGKTVDGISVCDYRGTKYYQGQTWNDGCQYTCQCADATTGLYKCQTLCPTYQNMPSYCRLEQKPGECCSKPVCEFKTQQGSFTGVGTISGQGTSISPTAPPACVDAIPDCDRYGQNACVNFIPWARDNCRKYCNLCVGSVPKPTATDVCIYNGQAFHQGDTWQIACDTICTCENAVYGYYRCVSSCPQYTNIPSTCQVVKNAGDCCSKVECQPGTGTFLSSTGNLQTIGGGGMIQVPGQLTPTLPSGGTPPPGTGGTSYVAPSLRGCLYKGAIYIQGQTWEDGCEYSCTCDNADQGMYTCRQRCPEFSSIPSECRLEADASDPCCQIPKCQFTGAPIPVIPSYKPSITGHNMVEPPKPNELYQGSVTPNIIIFTVPGGVTAPTAQTGVTGGIGYCEYKGQRYQQAQQWEDGCLYNCVCEDASIGFYRCRDKCAKFPPLPSPCIMVQDPNNVCCQIPKCVFTGQVTSVTNAPTNPSFTNPPATTRAPIPFTTPAPKVCTYKGQQYSQGQQWFDGCDYKCTCVNADFDYSQCSPRCPQFFNVPAGCTEVPDPNDPGCCKVPQCIPTPPPGGTINPGSINTIAPGTFVGQPNSTTYVGYCDYKGQRYLGGARWDDGCVYTCVCENAATGRYSCTDKCPSYGALPAQCQMVPDFTNPCCQKPDCNFVGSFTDITGTLTPSPAPGGPTMVPNPNPTNAPAPRYCVYKSATYSQGQRWTDGCQYRCRCDDSSKGLYVCDDRCPSYPNVPPQCHMITDPNDSCCLMPTCDFTGTTGGINGTAPTPAPNMIPTMVPGVITGQANTPAPTPGPNGVTQAPQPLNYCEYKGSQYPQGATWDDGCDYTCRCVDATMGKYQCDEKCPKYASIPAQCHMVKDAAKPCCFKPVCDFIGFTTEITGQLTTPAPNPSNTQSPIPVYTPAPNPNPNVYPTPAPLPKEVCVYRMDQYTQGQQWYDGCNFKCTCENAKTGTYRCNERCASYQVPSGCTLVADPADPLCCKVPYCAPRTNSTAPIPTAPTGVITGGSVTKAPTPMPTPAPSPGQVPDPNSTPAPTPVPGPAVCVYKGKSYAQGQRWQDGCDYNCECVNAMTGQYRCTEICPKYPSLPVQCKLVQDFNQPCCQVPQCDFTGTTGEVTGQQTTLAPHIGPTLAPSPGYNPTPAPTPKKLCDYNGVKFSQGQRWDDGCDLKCVCENDMTGYYRCDQRCGVYQNLPVGCFLGTDPNDPCCRVPVCTNMPTPAPNPTMAPNPTGPVPTPGIGQTFAPTFPPNYSPTPMPPVTLAPPVINGQGVTPAPPVGVTTNVPPTPVCVYNGKSYTRGQTWQDGCQYNCECVDAMTGQYRCTQRCAIYAALPSNCRLVTSQSDPCCKEPVCTQPTPAPIMTPAPQPNPQNTQTPPVGPTLAPNPNASPAPTPAPNPNPYPTPAPTPVCVMDGKSYTQGQQWNVGCDKVCVCDNAMTGHYICNDRCKIFQTIPPECTMVPDPNDPICCQVPQCIRVPPTPGPTGVPPTMYTNFPLPIVTGTGTPPTMGPTPAPQPGQTTVIPTPAPKVCVYKNQQYFQGQRWQDGCDFNCVCDDGMTGKYTCTARCGTFPNLPQQCQLQRDPSDYCCYVPVCDWSQPTPNPYQTPSPLTTVAPHVGPTLAPIPGQPTTPAPTPGPQPRSFCVYNGVAFGQGQVINDGCSQQCRCDDASTNYYNCYDRCTNYPSVPAGCIMVTDPNDACCQLPQCNIAPTPAPNQTPAPNPLLTPSPNPNGPTLAPGVPNPNPTPAPNPYTTLAPIPTAVTGVVINNPNPTRPSSQRGFCVYSGVKYTTGQTWDDGCNFHCECLDDMTGQYKCTERCARYTNIPTYCVLVTDPNDQCCKMPYCTNIVPTPSPNSTPAPNPLLTPAPYTGVPTLAPPMGTTQSPNPNPIMTPAPQPLPKDVCVMNGKAYTQGQTWYDGCKQTCVCDDVSTGHYTCNQRCATYTNVPANCVMVPDSQDPVCCQIPYCTQPNSSVPIPQTGTHTGGPVPTPRPPTTPAPMPGYPTPAPGQPTLVPPFGTTIAPNPNVNPTQAPTPAPQVCVYKGSMYTQGQTWRDGCLYDCTCDDAMHGKYTCTDICPKYPQLPVFCTMVRDPMNPCCQKPDCTTPAPSPVNTVAPLPGQLTPAPTPAPRINFCVYKGVPLQQGQVFKDGCDKLCRCEDTMTNSVVCDDRCPTYPALQPGCTMVTDPNDQCCQTPQCSPVNPTSNSTVIPGVPGATITGSTQPNPNTPLSGKRDVCLYQGKAYTTGQTWDDGCTYNCVCVDGMTGQYRCSEKCPRYPNVPPSCSMIQDPSNQCCQKPYCPYIAPTPVPNPTPGPNPNPTPSPNIGPTQAPLPGQSTPAPLPGQPTPAPVPTQAPAPRSGCMYNNQMYRQNQVWYDACNKICKCEDESTGYYRCQERCAKYPTVPAGCTLIPDPKDPSCCKVASCPLPPTSQPSPTPGFIQPNPNTPAPPMVTGVAPVPTPSGPNPYPQPQPTPGPGLTFAPNPNPNVTPAPQPRTGCYFNGKVYQKGDKFDDGCDYHCVCVDDMTGQYSCTKRCADWPQPLPTQCVLLQDPNDVCCQKPYCDFLNPTPFPNGVPTPAPNPYLTPAPGQVTPAPNPNPTLAPSGYCVYKGVYYTQGQTWDDGCDKKCRCEDVKTGYYSCNQRCPVYNNLPTSCRLVTDPSDNCCLVPDCNTFTTPTPIIYQPGTGQPVTGVNQPTTTPQPIIMIPSPLPPAIITGTSSNNPGQPGTNTGGTNYCVYKSSIYTQGQRWDDGCQYECECFDQMRGQYRCTEKCPRYVNLPPYCTYKQDPAKPCCKTATCDLSQIPTPAPPTAAPITIQPGTNPPFSGTNPITLQPGTNPPYTGVNPITIQPGTNLPYTGVNPITLQPGTNPPNTGARVNCVYKDMSQHPMGSTWQDGCETCVCEDPSMNSYKCNSRCPVYSDLPTSCYLVQDPKDTCCKQPMCSGTLNPQTITGNNQPGPSGTNPVPIGSHNTFSGSGRPDTLPGYTSSGLRSMCVYKGTVHQQGESWDDGCDFTCTCADGMKGLYTCTSKCPSYPTNIPSYCTMNTVPGMCCKSLSCNIPQVGNYQPAPMLVPTPAPTPGPGLTPTPGTGNPPSVIYPSGTQPVIGGSSPYPGSGYALPPGVVASSIRNQCVYKQRLYNQGETWDDGCDYRCECKDASTGYYECKPQCARYTLPQGCYTVKAAGQCCEQPVCQKPDGTDFNPLTHPSPLYPVYGSYSPGTGGFRPGYNPSTGTVTGTGGSMTGQGTACVYKGRLYSQGQRWDDGCDYTCQCTDAAHGMYTCNPHCPTYTNLPSSCHMVTLPGQCCQEPRCNMPSTTTIPTPQIHNTPAPVPGGCADAIPNCAAYGVTSCRAPYEEWARQNCNAYCGFCNPTTGQTQTACADKLPNCAAFDASSCTGIYEPWARDNCRKTCNLCSTTVPPYVTAAPQPTNACSDKLSNCNQYDMTTACSGQYRTWAIDNCQKTCNLCGASGNYGTTVMGSSTDSNWMILMKGVAGVPGDLYNLWSTNRTENSNVPEAMYLTSTYQGHYKPDLSNYWSSLCIDKVKVAVFNGGIERANIIFDATGADKMSWFDPNRIISSTWTDIKYAPKNIFSLLGDPSSGREFFASSSGSGCNTQGWIMVSTQGNCPFEAGSQKPAFYFAPGQTSVNFGQTAPLSGDVFAILAHPNCAGPTQPTHTIVATSQFCIYKNQIYQQGQTWMDGCQYNCTCEDAKTGFYRCNDMCPVWNNLPNTCTLQKPAGECCSKPVCQGGVILNQNNLTNTCFYGGSYYRQGEQWQDGCKYNCECKDGNLGFYECQTLCLQWNLPPSCHLDPPPAGKCCQIPVCPPNIQVQYPPGFVQH